jgi:hypothetical protein
MSIKHWLAGNHDNVSEWSYMSIHVASLKHIIMIPSQPVFDRHVAPLRHIIMILNQPVFDRHVAPLRHIMCLSEATCISNTG